MGDARPDDWVDFDDDEQEALREFPPGEEGMLLSHAGQDSTFHQVLEGVRPGCSEQPGLAFPLRLFEIYRQLHRVCPRFSLDALSKTLTHLHARPRKSTLHDQLVIAYDAYLSILRAVEARCQEALGRTRTWYMDNVCPPCFYKLSREQRLRFSYLAAMDGNNSLKLVDPTYHAGKPRLDNRTSVHDRWVSAEYVDEFKDEVADSQKVPSAPSVSANPANPATPTADSSASPADAPHPNADDLDEDVAWLNVNELESMQAEELAKCINTCVDRWRNAGPEQRKKMYALFAVAGIFLVVCRHGHVVVMCDMIRSGELMKYPLAMVQRLLDRYGKDVGLGYDIMCAFFKTLLRSSLGQRVVAMNMKGVVPAFHGHAHNRACQIGWHPLYVDGVGLEDFEECERTFAKSNHLGSVTRLTTAFHRKQAIDEHFYFHDLDKHAASGNFIYQNYRQAIEKIAINRSQLDVLEERNCRLHGSSDETLRARAFDYNRLDYNIMHNGYTSAEIKRVRTRYRTSFDQYLATQEETCRHEERHNIEVRWTPTSKEYCDALVMMSERRYKQAVDELERLVVGRLFEMTKLGMSGVAYKLREHLNKALKTRAEAIRKALERYNAAAAALDPPRPHLTWRAIIDNASLAEFDWLRETRQDIRQLPWAQPARREAMVLYFGIKRAEEEKVRLNVEIRRLITAMYDDHVDYYRGIAATIITDPPVANSLSQSWAARTRINTSIVQRLAKTARLAGFTGSLFPGEPVDVQYEEVDDVDIAESMTDTERRQYHASGLAREEEFDENLVVELMETLTTNDM
ncbi:hypothetical protein DFH06DRAFT_1272023 [Mycena polygramma]|nr:hypothetical protein DFH06DRAFT_1272023 [Mycena polygramma]